MEAFIEENKLHRIKLVEDTSYTLKSDCSLYIECTTDLALTLHLEIEKGVQCKCILWNNSNDSKLTLNVNQAADSLLSLSLAEMSEKKSQTKCRVHLKGENASVNMISAAIAKEKLDFDYECIHHVAHTSSVMNNYAIVYENASYKLVDSGKIEKGAYGSESHQSTRVLTLSPHQTSSVTPLLLIDEDDVQASHACSIGTIDELSLYYLQSRGLTKQAALGLITIGYLMPVANLIEDEVLQAELTAQIEQKVGL